MFVSFQYGVADLMLLPNYCSAIANILLPQHFPYQRARILDHPNKFRETESYSITNRLLWVAFDENTISHGRSNEKYSSWPTEYHPWY